MVHFFIFFSYVYNYGYIYVIDYGYRYTPYHNFQYIIIIIFPSADYLTIIIFYELFH